MADMRDRLIELIGSKVCDYYSPTCDEWGPHSCEKCYANDCRIGDLADHLLANGVILPPCKVGDAVYYISFGKVYKGECHAITLKPTMQIHIYDYDGDNASLKADRVFLTREEAEKALREKENG